MKKFTSISTGYFSVGKHLLSRRLRLNSSFSVGKHHFVQKITDLILCKTQVRSFCCGTILCNQEGWLLRNQHHQHFERSSSSSSSWRMVSARSRLCSTCFWEAAAAAAMKAQSNILREQCFLEKDVFVTQWKVYGAKMVRAEILIGRRFRWLVSTRLTLSLIGQFRDWLKWSVVIGWKHNMGEVAKLSFLTVWGNCLQIFLKVFARME